jgi:hypothetical protein
MKQPHMDRFGVVRFPSEGESSDEPPRMGDSLVRDRDSSELELEQERDLREIEAAERRKVAKGAIRQMLERFDEWYCDEELRENRG